MMGKIAATLVWLLDEVLDHVPVYARRGGGWHWSQWGCALRLGHYWGRYWAEP